MEDYKSWCSKIKVKTGVSLKELQPEMLTALKVFYDLYADLGRVLTVTSTTEGIHSANSLHYQGYAIDLRIWGLSDLEIDRIVKDARDQLGSDFDVLRESTHIHVEYDPKPAKLSLCKTPD